MNILDTFKFLIISCIFSVTLAHSRSSPKKCASQLEKVLYKPATCGKEYFQQIEANLATAFLSQYIQDPLRIGLFCEKFSFENRVGLNILDQNGVDLCSIGNTTATLLETFLSLLNSLTPRQLAQFEAKFATLTPPTDALGLNQAIIFLLNLVGTFGVVKNFSNPLPINVLEDGICYYAFNQYFIPFAILFRIVLSQPVENIIQFQN